jgi:hypothetical protein
MGALCSQMAPLMFGIVSHQTEKFMGYETQIGRETCPSSAMESWDDYSLRYLVNSRRFGDTSVHHVAVKIYFL